MNEWNSILDIRSDTKWPQIGNWVNPLSTGVLNPLVYSFQSPFPVRASTPAEIFGSKRGPSPCRCYWNRNISRTPTSFFSNPPICMDLTEHIGPGRKKTSLSGPTSSWIEKKKSTLPFFHLQPKVGSSNQTGGGNSGIVWPSFNDKC